MPRGTLFSGRLRRDELMSRQANKLYKSFQIFQILFFIIIYLFDLFGFVRFLPAGHSSFSRLRREIIQIFPNPTNPFPSISICSDLFRFVRFLSAGHSLSRLRRDELMSRQANKLYKSFQIFQILFFIIIYLFDLFRCFPNIGSEASVARRTPDEKTGLIFPQR